MTLSFKCLRWIFMLSNVNCKYPVSTLFQLNLPPKVGVLRNWLGEGVADNLMGALWGVVPLPQLLSTVFWCRDRDVKRLRL